MVSRISCMIGGALAALMTGCGAAAAGDFEISAYGGLQGAADSTIDLSASPSFDASWDGKSLSAAPPYYGARLTYWLNDFGRPDLGVTLDYTHAKVYADDETFARTPGWTRFEFTDGLNLVTANLLYRFQNSSAWTPYVGVGAGINVPHVEVTRPSGTTFGYEFGGATLQAQAGVSYAIDERWSAFAEYKGNYSFVNVPIDSGETLKTNIMTNAVNVGISFKW